MQRIPDREARFADREKLLHTLLVAALAGDGSAYQAFLKALSEHLRAYFRKRLNQRPDFVEDMLQETLLAVHNQRHTYRVDQPLTAWVHAIARYKLIDWLRVNGARDALTEPLDDELEVFTASDTDASDAKKDLGQLLDSLPERQRLPIVHMKLEGLSVQETAKLTGMSESAIKVGVHRGLKALAARIRESS
jgi:RNA polymerase sigma-70 factor (ECF subfamily)